MILRLVHPVMRAVLSKPAFVRWCLWRARHEAVTKSSRLSAGERTYDGIEAKRRPTTTRNNAWRPCSRCGQRHVHPPHRVCVECFNPPIPAPETRKWVLEERPLAGVHGVTFDEARKEIEQGIIATYSVPPAQFEVRDDHGDVQVYSSKDGRAWTRVAFTGIQALGGVGIVAILFTGANVPMFLFLSAAAMGLSTFTSLAMRDEKGKMDP